MRTLEINEIEKYLDAAPKEMNLMFIGDTGVGKTTKIQQYCKDRKIFLKTLILSRLEPSESLGMAVKATKEYDGKMFNILDTALPKWIFELAAEKEAMLFLDEFLCAKPDVMNSFLNFLTEKQVEGIDLSHVRIVAATNIGNYTFEPDNNILSRFCMFYTINSTAKEYVNDTRINYRYKDENAKTGEIFEPRSLKPRCYEQLSFIKNNELYFHFYEGFTNESYISIHEDEEINDLLFNYFEVNNFGIALLNDSNLLCVTEILKSKFRRVKKWDNIVNGFVNIDEITLKNLNTSLSA